MSLIDAGMKSAIAWGCGLIASGRQMGDEAAATAADTWFAAAALAWRVLAALTLSVAFLPVTLASPAEELTWFRQGVPTAQARSAVMILSEARQEGLRPEDYQADVLAAALRSFSERPAPDAARARRVDQALTLAMERYLRDLHSGRIDPREIHEIFDGGSHQPFDARTILRDALAQDRLLQAVREAAPRFPLYPALRKALAHYVALERDPAWRAPLPPLPGRKLEAGQPYAGIAQLAERLIRLGDMPAGVPIADRYEGAVVEGVKSFQRRHGLDPDGVVGPATFEQLQVTPAARAVQIALTMERLRWTPLLQASRMVVVNIPEFVLRAYDVRPGGGVDLKVEMKVIVGRALNTRTPIFDEEMRFIEFSPYWNIPPSIARAETVPALRRDPGYLRRQDMEFVFADGRVAADVSETALQAVMQGSARIRQRPGPRNALGDIKFVFPNNDNIYLHHTPAVGLFERARRDFSHGCIRVEDPVALAQFVLAPQPDWTLQRIRDAMNKGESRTIALRQPLPVLIAYATVVVRQGNAHFFADLYGHDKLLASALNQQRRPQLLVQ